jgi:hypothetical protein
VGEGHATVDVEEKYLYNKKKIIKRNSSFHTDKQPQTWIKNVKNLGCWYQHNTVLSYCKLCMGHHLATAHKKALLATKWSFPRPIV